MVVYADLLAMLAMAQLREHSILKGKSSRKLRCLSYPEILEIVWSSLQDDSGGREERIEN